MITANNLRNQPSAVFVFGTPHGALTRYLYEILLRRNATLRVYHPTASGVEKAAFHHVRTIAIAAEPDLPTEGLAEMVQTARRLGIHFCAVGQRSDWESIIPPSLPELYELKVLAPDSGWELPLLPRPGVIPPQEPQPPSRPAEKKSPATAAPPAPPVSPAAPRAEHLPPSPEPVPAPVEKAPVPAPSPVPAPVPATEKQPRAEEKPQEPPVDSLYRQSPAPQSAPAMSTPEQENDEAEINNQITVPLPPEIPAAIAQAAEEEEEEEDVFSDAPLAPPTPEPTPAPAAPPAEKRKPASDREPLLSTGTLYILLTFLLLTCIIETCYIIIDKIGAGSGANPHGAAPLRIDDWAQELKSAPAPQKDSAVSPAKQ